MRVVVTGATGHLGTHLVSLLERNGHEVIAVSKSGAPVVPAGGRPCSNVRSYAIDIADETAVDSLSKLIDTDTALIHLAAYHPPATATTTSTQRAALLQVNVYGTMRLLEAARSGVRCVIYGSSFEVYGTPQDSEIDETHRTYPLSDYGATKLCGEHHVSVFGHEETVRVASLRMPAIYGPGETASRALPNFLRAVLLGEPPTIFGDGADERDQLHVRDAAHAFLSVLESNATGIFNIADGERHSINEIAKTAMCVADLPGAPLRQPRNKRRLDYHLSVRKARHEFSFTPRVDLAEGMQEQLSWLRSNG